MIHNVRVSESPSVRPEPYNLPKRNRYELVVKTKKLRVEKIGYSEVNSLSKSDISRLFRYFAKS